MRFRIRQFWTLTGLTALEAIRQPLCLLLTTACILLNAFLPLLTMHHFGEEGRLARDGGLALHLVIGLLVAGYTACSTLAREMRDGTASMVLSKPVGRELFYVAKFAGISAMVLLFSVGATAGTLLAERISERFIETDWFVGSVTEVTPAILLALAPFAAMAVAGFINFRFRRPFQSTATVLVVVFACGVLAASGFLDAHGRLAPFHLRVSWRVASANGLVTMALLVISAIALGLSTRLGMVPTMAWLAAIFALGLMSEYWFGQYRADSTAALICHRLIPDWQHFWMSDALGGGGTISWAYMRQAAAYAGACLAGVLMLGVVSFRHAEMR